MINEERHVSREPRFRGVFAIYLALNPTRTIPLPFPKEEEGSPDYHVSGRNTPRSADRRRWAGFRREFPVAFPRVVD